eukprot:TRINITY_DN9107_c0_g1_i1.p1 TRINITY_DN9107_c0_g1~~TRINITY_DN9107_c0_g1_i1.p1  ORF type:complete len:328 (+),score=111.38 TRINITY_DN9107_c0_g1_i1:47-985(+)
MSDGTMNTEVPISADGLVYHIAARAEDVADNILLVGDPGRVEFVASFFDEGSIRFKASNREIVTITGTYKGVEVSAMSTGMGTDNVEIVLTEIHILKEFDAKRKVWKGPKQVNIIRCGTCGCPQSDIAPGSLAITHLAIGLDNTGKYYSPKYTASYGSEVAALAAAIEQTSLKDTAPYISSAHPLITSTLRSLAAAKSRPSIVGHTASAPGFYACQGRKVGRLSDIRFDVPVELARINAAGSKVANIEMETSALCHISHILGYRSGAICVVVANRAGGKGSLLPDSDKKPAMTDCVTLALDTFATISPTSKM